MKFLKTLFWIVVAVLITYFAAQNWKDVTIDLWGNLQADVKIPILLLLAFLVGFVPTWFACRATVWRLENRISTIARDRAAPLPDDQVDAQ